jgi:hypothetical protein
MERRYVRQVLNAVGGNKTHAARILGIDRRSLYRRLEEPRADRKDEGAPAAATGSPPSSPPSSPTPPNGTRWHEDPFTHAASPPPPAGTSSSGLPAEELE